MSNKKKAVLSFSGGMDSSTLLLNLLANSYDVTAVSFNYGQKHSLELKRAKELISYLKQSGINLSNGYNLTHQIIALDGLSQLLNSSLVVGGTDVPEGHYASENMKNTVVPNRNKIFSSIIQSVALSIATQGGVKQSVDIALGIHAGDHCFSRTTNILTPLGLKNIDHLKEGNDVYSFNIEKNKWELDKINAIIKKNIVPTINVISTCAGNLELTNEHKVYRLKLDNFNNKFGYNKSIECVKVSELSVNDLLVQPTGIIGFNNEVKSIDLLPIAKELVIKYNKGLSLCEESEFIWLGGNSSTYRDKKIPRHVDAKGFVNILAWYIAEGWSQKTPYKVKNKMSRYSAQFSQSLSANLEKVELIQNIIQKNNFPIKYEFSSVQYNKIPKDVTFYVSNILSIFMKECGGSSYIKNIPSWLMDILMQDNELREEFLYIIGLADGFNTETLYRGFCSTSKILIEQVITLLQLSGYHFSLCKKTTNTQYINYSKLGQKSAIISLGNAKFTKIRSIVTKEYNDHVFDITVEKNHNFAAGQYGSLLISNSIYPDCRQEFRDADLNAFRVGNWDSELVNYYTPYLNGTKYDILKDGENCCETLSLDFNEVYKRTNTSYKPIEYNGKWYSDYKSASSIERLLAFHELGRKDPVEYADQNGPVSYEAVVEHALKIENDFIPK